MDIKTGYINATKLCILANLEHKKFNQWARTDSAQKIIDETAKHLDMESSDLLRDVKGGQNMTLRGVYVHPDIIIEVARWLSVEFRFKCNRIIEQHFSKQVIAEKEAIIGEQKNTIADLQEQLRKFEERAERKLNEMLNDNKELKNDTKELLRLNRITDKKLDTALQDRVVHTDNDKDKTHLILIDNHAKYIDQADYTVLRIQKTSIKNRLKQHKIKYPKMKVLLEINYSPNAVILWKKISKYLVDNELIKVHGSDFDLIEEMSNQELINIFNRIHKQRLDKNSL